MTERRFQPGGYARPLRLAFGLLLGGLFFSVAYLQVRPTERLQTKSQREQTRLVYVPPLRGELQDRNGRTLNLSVPSYALVLRPELVRDPRDTRRRTVEKLSAEIADLAMTMGPQFYPYRPSVEKIERHLREQPALPLELWDDLDAETMARWTLVRREHPAAELRLTWRREYHEPTLAPQLRGMVKRSNGPRTIDGERLWNANAPELVGGSGLEKAMEEWLVGTGGVERLQTDVLSYRSTVLEEKAVQPGENCRLALCAEAQRVAEELFAKAGHRGAAVALDAKTGEVLVNLSMPQVPLGVRDAGEGGAYQNRVLSGYYPPGSTLKPLLALYALEKGIVSADKPVLNCPGYFALGERSRLRCSHIHGEVALVEAIAQSCNVYFCDLATRLTSEQSTEFSTFFGFGERTGGILSSEESAGIAFSPQWVSEKRNRDRAWHFGDAANAGIGQGGWIVTPLQLALAYGYLLTGNLLVPQYLFGGEVVARKHRDWGKEGWQAVLSGLRGCVLHGTGQSLQTPKLSILGKTGTAEVGKGQRPHAWIVAAAPAEKPRFVVVVCVENGGGGGRVAGPIAREILLKLSECVD